MADEFAGKVADVALGLFGAGGVFLGALVGLDDVLLDFVFGLLIGGDVAV